MCKEKGYPLDTSDPQQPQPVNGLDSDLMRLVHSELEANPGVLSRPKIDAAMMKYLDAQLRENLDEDEDQAMDERKLWQDLYDREQNFYDSGEWNISKNSPLLPEFEALYMDLEVGISRLNEVSALRLIYSKTYDFVMALDLTYSFFGKSTPLYKIVFDSCMFTGLCMFLHNTKRIKGSTLSQYIYDHSRFGYNDKTSSNYIKHEGTWKQGERTESLDSDERTLRQFRHRLFKSRIMDNRRPEGSAMPKYSEYEWEQYFDYVDASGKGDPQLRETLKRIKNLYNGVYEAINSPKDNGYGKRLEDAYVKFQSKLQKIKYKDYLALCKSILEYIERVRVDAEAKRAGSISYGINLYRFEKLLCLFEFTNDVSRLLKSEDEQERADFYVRSSILRDICFPKIRNEFWKLNSIVDVEFIVCKFSVFINDFISLSRLLVDKFIEDGHFGENWEKHFVTEINRMAEQIFYTSNDIDYSIDSESQEAFEMILMNLAKDYFHGYIPRWPLWP